MAVYLNIPGVKGGATEKNHEGWLKVDSLQFGVGRAISSPVGASSSREASQPTVSEITVSKPMDNSSIELFGWSVSKFDSKTLKIDIVSAGRDDPFTQYELENAVISGYSVSAPGEGMPMESISFNFTKIQEKFMPVGADQKAGTPVVKGYDLALAKAT
jgi:type VI secretion system secreted protein Hcp